jgi:hypothetical protein
LKTQTSPFSVLPGNLTVPLLAIIIIIIIIIIILIIIIIISLGTTENCHIGHCTHTAESADVKVH